MTNFDYLAQVQILANREYEAAKTDYLRSGRQDGVKKVRFELARFVCHQASANVMAAHDQHAAA